VARFERELTALAADATAFDARLQEELWRMIGEFTPIFLARHTDGAVVRVSCTLKELDAVMGTFEGPAVARAGSGVAYGYFEQTGTALQWLADAVKRGWRAVVEFAPAVRRNDLELWPAPGGDLEIMQRIKQLFDPDNLLNRDRLYRRI
jgi:FAD/FMN-containing dehydrogenase